MSQAYWQPGASLSTLKQRSKTLQVIRHYFHEQNSDEKENEFCCKSKPTFLQTNLGRELTLPCKEDLLQ